MSDHETVLRFRILHPFQSGRLETEMLPAGWIIRPLSEVVEKNHYYDTFEWQAYQKGIAVIARGDTLRLFSLESGKEIASTGIDPDAERFFSSDLLDSHAGEILARCSGSIRAFTRIASIEEHASAFRIMDADEKTVGILRSESLFIAGGGQSAPFALYYSVTPLKGYHEEMDGILDFLLAHSESCYAVPYAQRYTEVMMAADRQINAYSSRVNLSLDPYSPIHESALRLLRATLNIMRANDEGIRQMIDTEFLHDYRVSVRRTRSILKQLKGVFDPDDLAPFLVFFKEVGKETNALRDYDVSILEQHEYTIRIPVAIRPGLDKFFRKRTAIREELQSTFCSYLDSERYSTFLNVWEAFINLSALPDIERAPKAEVRTDTYAKKAVRKAWTRIVVHGRMIGPGASDAELHALRIDCKRLRYQLEFFSSIFPMKTVAGIVRRIKSIQDTLGDVCDCSVQLDELQKELSLEKDPMTAAAIGGLMTSIHNRKEGMRAYFHDVFSRFDDSDTAELFKELANR